MWFSFFSFPEFIFINPQPLCCWLALMKGKCFVVILPLFRISIRLSYRVVGMLAKLCRNSENIDETYSSIRHTIIWSLLYMYM